MAKLNVLTGPLRDQSLPLEPNKHPAILGRAADNIDFRIPDPAISRRHAEFVFQDEQWHLRDLNSANGTFINEIRIREMSALTHKDQVRCGSTVLLFYNPAAEKEELSQSGPSGPVELVFDPGETMVAVAFDSLASKQTAQQKKRMMEAGQATMNLSHGIKNILQAVRSGQDVMDEAIGYQDIDQAKRAWNILKRNLERVQKLVLDMLKFSKDEVPKFQPCHFNRLVESVVETLRPQADQREVGVLVHIDEHLELVPMDPEQIQDVVLNLLINALEAVPPKTGQITVQTELDTKTQQVILRISDNGAGIDNLEQIFEAFHSTKSNVGAGLGLTIAKKIILNHGGTIDAQSLSGEGSIFTVRIPIKKD
jgi:signal transduction histidine kinase